VSISRFVGRYIVRFAMALGVSYLAGCASAPTPIAMTCTITASKDVNPASMGRASPIQLRVYALKSAATFSNADFIALYQHDQVQLATDLTSRDEYTLAPGDSKSCSKMLTPDTRFIGVVGAFRDIEHARWRSIAPVEAGKKATVNIQTEALAVTVTVSR
jgi:type VI secretion system protein VasD